MSDSLFESLQNAWPVIDAERSRLYDEGVEENCDAWKQGIQNAVELERVREFGCNAEDAANRAFGYSEKEEDEED